MPYTYLLRCADGSLYVGSTWNLERRLWEHNNEPSGAAYTRHRRPVHLAWSVELPSIREAFFLEKQIQGWSRAKREALIREDWEALPELSSRPSARKG